ncbi:hypothetical protein D920_00269 [Enterococcus faecalis 13-SD-W-01]|nr:hypothetical protein D920_00269 [Enterococcus faecalis 13-SD-W-01]
MFVEVDPFTGEKNHKKYEGPSLISSEYVRGERFGKPFRLAGKGGFQTKNNE